MRRPCAALTSLVLILNPFTSPAWAWGRTGHRIISKLAERHRSEQAKAEIKALLEPCESLAGASTWADEVRGREPPCGRDAGRIPRSGWPLPVQALNHFQDVAGVQTDDRLRGGYQPSDDVG